MINRIKQEQLNARKMAVKGDESSKVIAKLLTTLIGESQVDGRDPTDDQLTKTIKKFLKNAKETQAIRDSNEIQIEIKQLSSYLPTFISKEQVLQLLEENKEIPHKGMKMALIKVFCQENNLTFDGKLVNSLI